MTHPPSSWPLPELFSARAIENQFARLAQWAPRRDALMQAIGSHTDLHEVQWNHLAAMALEFQPDLIIELGRGYGNSTAVWGEVAQWMGQDAPRIESLCLSDMWKHTREKLLPLVGQDWFGSLQIVRGDITAHDFATSIGKAKRVLVFWDAHGFEVAECVLGQILPLLQDRPNLIIMHDLIDTRYDHSRPTTYDGERLWRGNDWDGPQLMLGHIRTCVEQAISILDFNSRNGLELMSNDHDLAQWKERFPAAAQPIVDGLGKDWQWNTGLHYFSLPPRATGQQWTFPGFKSNPEPQKVERWGLKMRIRMALKALIRGEIT
jgi:hypothetical protein